MKKRLFFFSFLLFTRPSSGQVIFNDTLSRQLETILSDDQKYREELEDAENKEGDESPAYVSIMKKMCIQDSINEVKVSEILDKYGWLGTDVVGENGNSALWFVIQHSDLHMMTKYLPMMKDALKDKKLQASKMALLEDRMALWQGRKQIYGSQLSWNLKTKETFILPLEDPDNVDKRRASAGLLPLAEYLAIMNTKWEPDQYKKELPAIEEYTWRIPYYTPDSLNDVGEIKFDEQYDNPAFKIPDTSGIFTRPRFKGGKPAIVCYFKEGYINNSVADANGYVTVHFYVNNQGKPGKFRVGTMDFQYHSVKFERSISFQILHLLWDMKGWEPLAYEGKTYGYYCYLNFKIVNGQISSITP